MLPRNRNSESASSPLCSTDNDDADDECGLNEDDITEEMLCEMVHLENAILGRHPSMYFLPILTALRLTNFFAEVTSSEDLSSGHGNSQVITI